MQKLDDGRLIWDIGVLYEEYRQLANAEDDLAFVEFIISIISEMEADPTSGYMLKVSLSYVRYAFFSSDEGLRSDFVWAPELAPFFNKLFKYKQFDAPLKADKEMILGSDMSLLIPHLEPISIDMLGDLLAVNKDVPKETWELLARKVIDPPKYVRMVAENPDLEHPSYLRDISAMDPNTFCLLSRLVTDANTISTMRILKVTTTLEFNYAWYFYMLIFNVPYSPVRYCFKYRTKVLGNRFLRQATLALAVSGYNHRMYRYFRYRAEEALRPFVEGRPTSLVNIPLRDAFEAALMLGASDDAFRMIMRVHGFEHDTQLLLLSLMKKRKQSFIEELMKTRMKGTQYKFSYFYLTFPGKRRFNLPISIPLSLIQKIFPLIDEPHEFLVYSALHSTDESIAILKWICTEDLLSSEHLQTILDSWPPRRLHALIPTILPHCIQKLCSLSLANLTELSRTSIRNATKDFLGQKSYYSLYSWMYSLNGQIAVEDSLLALVGSLIRA